MKTGIAIASLMLSGNLLASEAAKTAEVASTPAPAPTSAQTEGTKVTETPAPVTATAPVQTKIETPAPATVVAPVAVATPAPITAVAKPAPAAVVTPAPVTVAAKPAAPAPAPVAAEPKALKAGDTVQIEWGKPFKIKYMVEDDKTVILNDENETRVAIKDLVKVRAPLSADRFRAGDRVYLKNRSGKFGERFVKCYLSNGDVLVKKKRGLVRETLGKDNARQVQECRLVGYRTPKVNEASIGTKVWDNIVGSQHTIMAYLTDDSIVMQDMQDRPFKASEISLTKPFRAKTPNDKWEIGTKVYSKLGSERHGSPKLMVTRYKADGSVQVQEQDGSERYVEAKQSDLQGFIDSNDLAIERPKKATDPMDIGQRFFKNSTTSVASTVTRYLSDDSVIVDGGTRMSIQAMKDKMDSKEFVRAPKKH